MPTLYEALLRLPSMDNADLSSLKGVFSGGDSLSIELKKKFDKFLYDHHAVIQVREGYGTTETVTACCLTPTNMYKEGSIGLQMCIRDRCCRTWGLSSSSAATTI